MKAFPFLWLGGLWLAGVMLSGCVAGSQPRPVSKLMPRPSAPSAELTAYAAPKIVYPSVGGDILNVAKPEDLAAARDTADKPMSEQGLVNDPPK